MSEPTQPANELSRVIEADGSEPAAAIADSASPRGRGPTASETRERILDVAEALFAEQGFAATSVRDIAANVGLTPASLYNHFNGKGGLYEAVLERGVRPLVQLMHDLTIRDPGNDSIDQVIEGVMAHLSKRPHVPRLVYHEVLTGGARIVALAKDWIRPIVDHGLLEMQGQGPSVWTRDEQPLLIASWMYLVFGHFAMAPLLREVMGQDPLHPSSLATQTQFLRKLAEVMSSAERPAPQGVTDGEELTPR